MQIPENRIGFFHWVNERGLRLFVLSIVAFCILCGCGGPKQSTRVTNKDGNYSLEILPGWIHEVDGATTRASRFETIDGEVVSSTLMVREIVVVYDDLDKNFESQVPSLENPENFRKISDGRTEINGSASRWIRLNKMVFSLVLGR